VDVPVEVDVAGCELPRYTGRRGLCQAGDAYPVGLRESARPITKQQYDFVVIPKSDEEVGNSVVVRVGDGARGGRTSDVDETSRCKRSGTIVREPIEGIPAAAHGDDVVVAIRVVIQHADPADIVVGCVAGDVRKSAIAITQKHGQCAIGDTADCQVHVTVSVEVTAVIGAWTSVPREADRRE